MDIGLNTTAVRTSAEGPEFRVGTVMGLDDYDDGRKEFLYVNASEAITGLGYACVVDGDGTAEMLDNTSAAPGAHQSMRVGAAQAAIESGGYGWVQIYGKGSLRTAASAAAGTALNSTATAGQVDDDATAGAEVIDGLSLGTATGVAAAVNSDASFNYPQVGATG